MSNELAGFVLGLTLGLVLLASIVVRNRRRIRLLEERLEPLERRQRAHDIAIKYLAEEGVGPLPPAPVRGRRRRRRVVRGAAVAAGVGLLARRHPLGAVLAAAGTAAAGAVLAVTVSPGPSVRSTPSSLEAPSSALAASTITVPAAPSAVPATFTVTASVPAGVPSSAASAPAVSPPAPPVSPAPAYPVLAVSLPVVTLTVMMPSPSLPPLPTGSLVPSLPAPSVSVSDPAPSASPSCLLDVALPAVLNACVL